MALAGAGLVVALVAVAYLHPRPAGRPLPRPTANPSQIGVVRLTGFGVVSATEALACTQTGGTAYLYWTADAGRTWRQLPIPLLYDDTFGIQAIDRTHAVLQLGKGLYSTGDGGRTWRRVPLPAGEMYGPGAHFLSPSEGWYLDLQVDPASSEQPTALWWTSDGGASWTERWRVNADHPLSGGVPLEGDKYVLAFRDAAHGWLTVTLVHSARLLATSDGGRTWSDVSLPLAGPVLFLDLQLARDGAAVLVALAGTTYLAVPSLDGGRTWEEPRALPIAAPAPGGSASRLSVIDHDHWAVAAGATVRVTADAGRSWRDIATALPGGITALQDVWLTAAGEGWATTDHGSTADLRVLHTTDGGARWSESHVPYVPG